MNLDGKCYPEPHPAWGVCADELLFHTSRYAVYTARRLAALANVPATDLAGFHASRMDAEQRACMARLLARPPQLDTAKAIVRLASAVADQETGVPEDVRWLAGRCGVSPHIQLLSARPHRSTGLAKVNPADVLRHFGRRYGFDVRIQGQRIWLDSRRFEVVLGSSNSRVQRNIEEVLQDLSRAGYTVYGRRALVAEPRFA